MIIDWKTNSLQYERKIRYKRYKHPFLCPTCKRKRSLRRHGYYKRYLIQWGGCIREEEIRVLRMQCASCKHTHAILPKDVIPYKVYGWSYFWVVLRLLSVKGMKVAKCVAVLKTYFKMIYAFLKKYREFISRNADGYMELCGCLVKCGHVRKAKQLMHYTTLIVNRINV